MSAAIHFFNYERTGTYSRSTNFDVSEIHYNDIIQAIFQSVCTSGTEECVGSAPVHDASTHIYVNELELVNRIQVYGNAYVVMIFLGQPNTDQCGQ